MLARHYRQQAEAEALAAQASGTPQPWPVAITVDDLPVHGALPPGGSRLAVAQAHVRALAAHGVPQAWGFVNAQGLSQDPEGEAVLASWRAAGHPLGNHSYSHMNLARADSLAAWADDVIAGEAAVARHMAGEDWRWFRYPNLAVGTGERQAAGLSLLRERGYRVADVSLAFGDWDYSDAYARCLARGDQASVQAMIAQYFRQVDLALAQTRAQAQQVFGRPIPLVLLTHLGAFSAATLPELLRRLDVAGAHYISLEQAQSDPAYAQPGGGSLISRAARERGIALAGPPSPPPSLEPRQLCR